ncbi:polysaccharide deacetylase family protein [Andreprevotia chitinilytica]|uniref:polysaccharide deacetylase family protein n=1 Tax=Andreprevotia chitinilytica TaxID=396808 RepID=UPI0005595199|nr:polysaccharide deacetylase family protein [Andreprevotia chitinilytica]
MKKMAADPHCDHVRPNGLARELPLYLARLGLGLGLVMLVGAGASPAAETTKPQLIMFSIDDGVTAEMAEYTAKLPVPWTFFVSFIDGSNASTPEERNKLRAWQCVDSTGKKNATAGNPCIAEPDLILKKYNEGNEIALHTYTHYHLVQKDKEYKDVIFPEEITEELTLNLQNLTNSKVPASAIRGFRAPYTEDQVQGRDSIPSRDEALTALQKFFNLHGIIYESSFSEMRGAPSNPADPSPRQGLRVCGETKESYNLKWCDIHNKSDFDWPTYGYPKYATADDPEKSWHILMNKAWTPPEHTTPVAASMDQAWTYCFNDCNNAKQVQDFWMFHFLNHYNNDRTPFGVHIHLRSLHGDNKDSEFQLQGMIDFVKEVQSKYPDAYFVTGGEIIDYAKLATKPTTMAEWDKIFYETRYWKLHTRPAHVTMKSAKKSAK